MLRISSLKLRGFKSFKKADIQFPEDFSALAGPNGSGKSNVCDAIRFVMGEQRLKALRAKKVKDLICHNAKIADVLLILSDGKEKVELRRAIREDGKVSYRLNGKKATRGTVVETLKKHSADDTGRNIIAQGEVQRVIEMNGRQRREIIDGVAGISEFEIKKKEAMRELETVENRMREANLVLGERAAFLQELEKEKGRAENYVSAREMLQGAKATLISRELKTNESRNSRISSQIENARAKLSELEKEISSLGDEIRKAEAERGKIADELSKKEKRDRLFKEMEDIRAELGSSTQALEDSGEMEARLKSELSALDGEIEAEKKALSSLEKEAERLKKELAPLEKKRIKYEEGREAAALREAIASIEKELARVREEALRCEGERGRLRTLIEEKRRMLEAYSSGEEEGEAGFKSPGDWKDRRKELAHMVDRLFQKEKELNEESASLDRVLLDLREKIAVLRAQSSPKAMNPALRFISELKASGEINGIHGPLYELVEFDPKYAEAVEAAGGNRLMYVVVDSADVAMKAVQRLKKAGAGRATFIPLKEVTFSSSPAKGGLGVLSTFVRHSPKYKRAVDFVFGSTLLVSDYPAAKKVGIGSARMVTLGGEIFERSAIVTGGKARGGVAIAAQLSKMESQLEEAKEKKNALLSELRQVREEMSSLRREKAECDVEVRKAELEEESAKKRVEEQKKRKKLEKETNEEIEEMGKTISMLSEKRAGFSKEEEKLRGSLSEKQKELGEAEKKQEEKLRKVEKEQEELTQKYSELRGKLDSVERENELRVQGISGREGKKKALREEFSGVRKKRHTIEENSKKLKEELESLEKRIGESNKTLEKLFAKSKEYEETLQEIGRKRGTALAEAQKFEKQMHSLEVEQASVSTRLTDLKAEMESFGEVKLLEETSKEKLTEILRSSEQQLSELGDVNLAAPEQYEKRKQEIAEVREKIERLKVERNAVMEMITSIEEKKKEAFLETFDAVNENFKKLFEHISIGEGFLYLDKPGDIFNSGLYIKLKRDGRENPLDALSGGEKTLLALMFVFALQFYKPSPFYVLDEVDASLDKANSANLARLLRQLSDSSQFIVVTHDDTVMRMASAIMGVARVDGISQIVGVKLPSAG